MNLVDTNTLSAPAEDCLLLIHRLAENEEPVSTSGLARGLGVTDSTVTAMVQRLARLGYLNHRPRKEISLTPQGRELSLKLIRRHRLIETYLHEKLGYEWDEVHEEAEKIEHAVSEKFVSSISAALGHPTVDPHGDPIPDRNGSADPRTLVRLSELAPGDRGRLARVAYSPKDALAYLADHKLKPGVFIEVLDAPAYDSVVTLIVHGQTVTLGRQLATRILIEQVHDTHSPSGNPT